MTKEKKLQLGEYELPDVGIEEVEVPTQPGEKQVPFEQLDPLSKIKIACEQNGVSIKKPNKSCKKCYGRGYVSQTRYDLPTTSGTSAVPKEDRVLKVPNPCKCIFRKEDIPKMFKGQFALGYKERRKYEKRVEKDNIKTTHSRNEYLQKKKAEIAKKKKKLKKLAKKRK